MYYKLIHCVCSSKKSNLLRRTVFIVQFRCRRSHHWDHRFVFYPVLPSPSPVSRPSASPPCRPSPSLPLLHHRSPEVTVGEADHVIEIASSCSLGCIQCIAKPSTRRSPELRRCCPSVPMCRYRQGYHLNATCAPHQPHRHTSTTHT